MASMPIQGTSKDDLFQELQKGTKPEIVDRLVGKKASATELVTGVSPDETPMEHYYQQIIL